MLRRKAFAFKHEFQTLEEANQHLLEVCMKRNSKPQSHNQNQTANELLDQERASLLPALPMFDAARVLSCRVDKYATVAVDQNRYSVPDHLVGEQVMVKVYATQILCFYDEKGIAQHDRLTGCKEWRLDLNHYLETLNKKPGALADSAALQQAPKKIKAIYDSYYIRKEKDFVHLLQYLRDDADLTEIERGITELCAIHPDHVTTDKIKVLCAKNREMAIPIGPLPPCEITDRAKEHLRLYDDLFQTHTIEKEEVTA